MAFDAHTNFAYSTVATAPSPASSGTSLVVASGDGAKFPTAPFNATVWAANSQPTTANAEIVRVTVISTDTFTITRTQESSSARSILVGDQIAATITAKTLTDVENASSADISRNTQGATNLTGQNFSVLNNATLDIATVSALGMLVVTASEDNATGIFTLNGGRGTTNLLNDPIGFYTTTQGTTTKINVYWDGTANRYRLENKRGSTITVKLIYTGIK